MWSRDPGVRSNRLIRLAAALSLAAATAACFQPLYGDRSATGGSALREALSAVDVAQIEAPMGSPLARIAVETRNELVFDLTGGGGRAAPTHKLTVRLVPSKSALILDSQTLRPEIENFGLDANYTLTEIVSGKTAVTGSAVTRVTYNVPGQQQRFAKDRGLRDAETRAAKEIAEQIRSRLASYFVAGT
jgi:LPS-assembly lipoprotein